MKHLTCHSNNVLTDFSSNTRTIASAKSLAIENCLIFGDCFVSGNSIEFVMTNSLIFELSIRSIAGPDNTGCVQQAYTSFAPLSIIAFAAIVIVPAVSIISSIR